MASSSLFLSTEAIRDQGREFLNDLSQAITQLKKDYPRILRWNDTQANVLARIIHEHTKAQVQVVFSEMTTAYSSIAAFDHLLKIIESPKEILTGSIDLVNAQLGGLFTKINNKFYFSYELFMDLGEKRTLSSEEAAAVMLHEIGHMVSYYYRLSKMMVLSNWALKDISEKYNENSTIEERQVLISGLKKNIKNVKLDEKTLSESTNTVTLTAMLVKELTDDINSDLGTPEYDITSDEFLADQFATKCGAGLYLITALEKMGIRERSSMATNFAMDTLIFITTGAAFIGNPIAAAILLGIWGYYSTPDNVSLRYDSPENRLRRIRFQIVEKLKTNKLSVDEKIEARAQLGVIDKSVKIAEDGSNFMEKIVRFVLPFLRKREKAQNLQLLLESLAFNDLFIKSFDFKQLSA